MNQIKNIILPLVIFISVAGFAQEKIIDNTFYVFNNCTRTLPNAPESMVEQAKLVKKLGYDGLFGLQCYNIKQDCRKALLKSISTWQNYRERYAKE